MLRNELLIILLISLCPFFTNATTIKGQIAIDETWEPVIYLSVINLFDDLNTASYDFLIYEADIDSLGHFEMGELEIPKEDRIYRLHVCKKGDPISTIIIGGKNENFVHFIMKNGDSITIQTGEKSQVFQNSIVEGNIANQGLAELFRLRKDLHSPPVVPSNQNRQFLRGKVFESYYAIADTSSHAIIQLIAMYFINDSFKPLDQIELMEKIQLKVQATDTSSPYFKAFTDELNFLKYQTQSKSKSKFNLLILMLVLIILIAVYALNKFSKIKRVSTIEVDSANQLSLLSVQEKRVHDLLKEGKTNKEISNELHIEVSTVKSHLNKIYSRLGVKSRKEIINTE